MTSHQHLFDRYNNLMLLSIASDDLRPVTVVDYKDENFDKPLNEVLWKI